MIKINIPGLRDLELSTRSRLQWDRAIDRTLLFRRSARRMIPVFGGKHEE
jgi:hypothetical protein